MNEIVTVISDLFCRELTGGIRTIRPMVSSISRGTPVHVRHANGALSLNDGRAPGHLHSYIVRVAIGHYDWNQTKAADHLGLKRTTLQYKIKKYGLE